MVTDRNSYIGNIRDLFILLVKVDTCAIERCLKDFTTVTDWGISLEFHDVMLGEEYTMRGAFITERE